MTRDDVEALIVSKNLASSDRVAVSLVFDTTREAGDSVTITVQRAGQSRTACSVSCLLSDDAGIDAAIDRMSSSFAQLDALSDREMSQVRRGRQ